MSVPCVDSLDYSQAVQRFWGKGLTVVNVEHDVACTDEQIQELLACPHPLCTHAYMLHMPSTGGAPHYAHRTGKQPPCGGDWLEEGDEWADFGGIGFCKITPETMHRPLPESTWQFVDIAIFQAANRQMHVHWPATEHYHR